MNREQAKKILGENATDEQINALLTSIHNEIATKDDEIKSLNDKLTLNLSEIEKYKASDLELQKIKQSQMTEQEKAEEMKKQLQAEMSKYNKLNNSVKAKAILVGAGISSENADNLVSKFVKEDEQATLDLANSFVAEFNSMKELTEKKVKDELSNINVKPSGSNVNPKTSDIMTWEKYQTLTPEEQAKFATEHPDEFESL